MQNTILLTMTIDDFKSLLSEAVRSGVSFLMPTENVKPDDDLMTINQVSLLLGRSLVTIHSWKKRGLIPFHRISRKIYFKKSEVLESLRKVERRAV